MHSRSRRCSDPKRLPFQPIERVAGRVPLRDRRRRQDAGPNCRRGTVRRRGSAVPGGARKSPARRSMKGRVRASSATAIGRPRDWCATNAVSASSSRLSNGSGVVRWCSSRHRLMRCSRSIGPAERVHRTPDNAPRRRSCRRARRRGNRRTTCRSGPSARRHSASPSSTAQHAGVGGVVILHRLGLAAHEVVAGARSVAGMSAACRGQRRRGRAAAACAGATTGDALLDRDLRRSPSGSKPLSPVQRKANLPLSVAVVQKR